MDLIEIKEKVKKCLKEVYDESPSLIEKYDIGERTIMHRFAFYLQEKFSDYWVDCEFDKKSYKGRISDKVINGGRKRVDIIIHPRGLGRDFLCFEIKKEGRGSPQEIEKDRDELKTLTSCESDNFQYEYGFLITFGERFNNSIYELYELGQKIKEGFIFDL